MPEPHIYQREREATLAILRMITAHLTMVTLGDGRPQKATRRAVFDEAYGADDPARAYLMLLGVTASLLREVSRREDVPLESLCGLFGRITRGIELQPSPLELHPSHPRWHR